MTRQAKSPDWGRWLRSWDEQQESFNPEREARFQAMFDALDAELPARFTALDVGCGPGSLTARLLQRFPRARCVAVDFDPVVLQVGRGALRRLHRRTRWVDADLRSQDWKDQLPRRRFDAALSTTALHWLRPSDLRRTYRDLGKLLRPGGVFLNGDHLPWPEKQQALRRLAERVRRSRYGALNSEWSGWERWWKALEREPTLKGLFAERAARLAEHPHHTQQLSIDFHERALREAGFRTVAVIWQRLENRVLLAIR